MFGLAGETVTNNEMTTLLFNFLYIVFYLIFIISKSTNLQTKSQIVQGGNDTPIIVDDSPKTQQKQHFKKKNRIKIFNLLFIFKYN